MTSFKLIGAVSLLTCSTALACCDREPVDVRLAKAAADHFDCIKAPNNTVYFTSGLTDPYSYVRRDTSKVEELRKEANELEKCVKSYEALDKAVTAWKRSRE